MKKSFDNLLLVIQVRRHKWHHRILVRENPGQRLAHLLLEPTDKDGVGEQHGQRVVQVERAKVGAHNAAVVGRVPHRPRAQCCQALGAEMPEYGEDERLVHLCDLQ